VDRREQRRFGVDFHIARRDPLRAVRRLDRIDQLLAVERGRALSGEWPRANRVEVSGADRGPELGAVLAALSRDEALVRTT